jgi:hypothetical protein
MPSPTRAELRAAFAKALEQQWRAPGRPQSQIHPIAAELRVAVEAVLGDPAKDVKDLVGTTTARHRAQFLALADAIEGGD